MPYTKKYSKKTAKKDNWEAKGARIGGSIGAIASKVKNIIQEINVERHHVYTTTGTAITTAGLLENVCNPALGTATVNRIGNSIKVQSLYSQNIYNMTAADIAASGNVILREIYFKWTKDGVAPAITDILNVVNPMSHYNIDTSRYYHIISNKFYHLNTGHNTGIIHNKLLSFKKAPFHVKWNEDSTTAKTSFYRILLTDSGNNVNRATYDKLMFVDN